MSLATALLTPILGDASPWTPRRLFQLGEAGGVYDPSDLTAEKVAWRRNLYLYSEPTSATGYTATNVTFTTNALFNFLPGGGACAELADATVSRSLRQNFTLTAGVTYTLSFYVTIAGGGLPNSGSGAYRDFTITRDNQDVTSYNTITYENLGGGVYRAQHTWLHTGVNGNVTVQKYSGFNTSTAVRLTGLQLEASPTATAYQRITDFTSDFLAAFPTHGLYQDAAGTTPVTALGQPVGLVIDSKTGGLANVGPELVSGGVIGLLGTATAATYSTTTGVGACTRVDISNQSYVEWSGLNNARLYRLRVQVTGSVAMWVRSGDVSAINPFTAAANATTQLIIAPSGGKITLTTQTGTATFTVLAFNEVPGVHAIQPTNSSRPLLDGRVNLLTFSEQYSDASWTKADTTVTANATTAPNGTTTADSLLETATTAAHAIYQAASVTSGASYQWTGYVRANGRTRIRLVCAATSAVLTADYNISAITATVAAGSGTVSIESIGSGWFRLFATATATATGTGYWQANLLDDNGNLSYLGDVTKGMFIWGADFRLAADSAYPYQRVAAATDYADVGVPRSFAFDGFDDSLYTASNMDLSSTDKVTVLAGVRKNADATAVIAELSADKNSNNGVFFLNTEAAPRWYWESKGTIAAGTNSGGTTTFPAPATSVVCGLGNISGDSSVLRVNGTQLGSNTGDQGTGNYGSYVLFIGRRNNASLPFNGKAYQLIVRGALTDDATLAQAERYVGAKTGIFL